MKLPLALLTVLFACHALAVEPLTDAEKKRLAAAELTAKRTPPMREAAKVYSEARKAYTEDRRKFPADRSKTAGKAYREATDVYEAAKRKAVLAVDPTIEPLLQRQAELAKLGMKKANEGETVADSDSSKNKAMTPLKDQPGLPRVLLIGDSISIGYTLGVREHLAGKANVHRIPQNGGATDVGLEKMTAWLGDGKWDVIHFNFGLHDAKYSSETTLRATREQYLDNLRKLIAQMKATGAKLIFATTTPVPKGGVLSPTRKFDSITARNEIAVKLMQEQGVAVDDLYSAVLPVMEKVGRPNDVHFAPEGYQVLAKAVAASVAAALGIQPSAAAQAAKPNFIVINIDDMGYADIGPFGSKINRTPHLDRMASEGRKLTCFYAAPVCSPSRAALMTGCYPKRVLPIPGVLFPSAAVGLNPAEDTIADLLKERGYATACIGKWHLGDQPEFLPTRQGFDYYLGIPYSNDMGPAEDGSKSSLGEKLPKPREEKGAASDDNGIRGGSAQPPTPLVENGKVIARVKQDEQQGIVERYTIAAVKFIKENRERPFFIYLPHTAVHSPLYPGKAFAGKSPHGINSDWIEEVDWSVGQVLDTLREMKLAEKTLVIFTSDNGGTTRAVNTPLRGNKATTWEGGMRVPTIAWWPGKIPAGTSSSEITGMFDVLPTFVKLAGGTLPADRKIDGADIWPLLAGEAGAKPPHDVFYYFRGMKLEGVRSGPWKLRLGNAGDPAKGAGKSKVKVKGGEDQLYNLDADIGETKNVAAENADVLKRLHGLVDAMKGDLGLNEAGPGVRPLGRVEKPQPLIGRDGTIRAGFAP